MRATDEKDHQLINDLQKLPELADGLSKDEWYQKIKQKEWLASKPNRKPLFYIVPSLLGVIVLGLLFIITDGFNFNIQSEQAADALNEAEVSMSQDAAVETFESPAHKDGALGFTLKEAVPLNDLTRGEHVLYRDEQELLGFSTATVGAMDESVMFPVPLTMVNGPSDLAVFYNDTIKAIDFASHGLTSLPFSQIAFGFQGEDLTEIVVKDPKQLAGTSAQATLFLETLRNMFAREATASVVIRTTDGEQVDLGAYGTLDTFELVPVTQAAYKYYRFNDTHTYMVPVEQTLTGEKFMTIDEALFNMQESNDDMKLFGAIPPDAEYQLDLSDASLLQISFLEHDSFGDNLATIEMMESILMTAKSFGFDAVNFSIASVESPVGPYQLEEVIEVPVAVNPTPLAHWLEDGE